jgi:hypothetical protein
MTEQIEAGSVQSRDRDDNLQSHRKRVNFDDLPGYVLSNLGYYYTRPQQLRDGSYLVNVFNIYRSNDDRFGRSQNIPMITLYFVKDYYGSDNDSLSSSRRVKDSGKIMYQSDICTRKTAVTFDSYNKIDQISRDLSDFLTRKFRSC